MMRLIICEKDNAARRISEILGEGRSTTQTRDRVPVYSFEWRGEETAVIGLKGHILNMDYPEDFNSWENVPPASLIDAQPVKKVSAKGIASVLRELASSASSVFVATDYDREGELIGAEAVEYALGEDVLENVKRAHFSSFTPEEVRHSFNEPTTIDRALANAAETRQVIDLVWGAVLTRFISLASGRLGHDFLSVGRVQSPTLALLVDREKEIRAFKPVPYWRIEGQFQKDQVVFGGHHQEGDIFEEPRAKQIFSRVKDEERARIESLNRKQRTDPPPTPFNTTQFIRAANNFGMSAARIMSIAEDLYTSGFISYPRTDNTVYPKGLDLRSTLSVLGHGPYKAAVEHLLAKERLVPTRGSTETTDHPPIYPTAYATKEQMGHEKFRIYDLVVRRFLATLHDPSRVEVTSVKMSVDGEPFNASGVVLVFPGWRSVYEMSKVEETPLPQLQVGDLLPILSINLVSKETKPPKRYSQGGLIQEMERLGLGTKSTRHEIIQKLIGRRYVEDNPTRPTLSGEALIISLEKHAALITEPDMTARLESDMERISKGELTKEEVIEESRDMLKGVLSTLEKHREAIGSEINEALQVQDVVGKCPRCNNDLLLTRSARGKRYIRCSKAPGCSRTYPLPQKGKIGFTNEACPVCRSPMMIMYRKARKPLQTCMNTKCPSKQSPKGRDGDQG